MVIDEDVIELNVHLQQSYILESSYGIEEQTFKSTNLSHLL